MKTVKSISSERFEVKLLESNAGSYYIEVTTYLGDHNHVESTMSDPIGDYSIASFAFDARIASLQGH